MRGYSAREQVARGIERIPRRRITPHSSSAASALGARRKARIVSRFTQSSASFSWMCWNDFDADRVHERAREAEHELGLGDVLDDDLVRHVHDGARARVRLVAALDVAVQEHALPRHEDVVEHDDGVHLLEARAERMIEMRAPVVDALAADESQARGVGRNREAERVGRVLGRLFSSVDGNTMISSAIGSVASMRAPRMTMPASVSSLTRAARYGSACLAGPDGAIGLRRDAACASGRDRARARTRGSARRWRRIAGRPRRETRAGRVAGHRAIEIVGHATHHAARVIVPDLHRGADAAQLRMRPAAA